jgi:putative membrane protein
LAPYFAFLHHLAAFTIFAALAIQFVLIKGELTLASAKKIQQSDLVYGIAAGVIVVVGLLRVFYFEKGQDYYFHSTPFRIKMTTFIIVGLLSIYPTIEFRSWSTSLKAGQPPILSAGKMGAIRKLLHFELFGLAVVIFCAALMAKGVGFNG